MTQKVPATQTVEGATAAQITQATLTAATTQATTSGTTITFGSIPSWVKRITVALNNVSLSSSGYLLVQLGSGSTTSSGYTSYVAQTQGAGLTTVNATAGLVVDGGVSSVALYGTITLISLGSNTWVASLAGGSINAGNFRAWVGGGTVTLSGVLDRVVLASSGADTFDLGSATIVYD